MFFFQSSKLYIGLLHLGGVTNYQRKSPVRNHHGLIKSVELQGKIFIW